MCGDDWGWYYIPLDELLPDMRRRYGKAEINSGLAGIKRYNGFINNGFLFVWTGPLVPGLLSPEFLEGMSRMDLTKWTGGC